MYIMPACCLVSLKWSIVFLALQTGFLGVVEGFSWVSTPHSPTYAFLRENATLRWHFNLSSKENLRSVTMKRLKETGLESMIEVDDNGQKSRFKGFKDHVDTSGIENIILTVFNVSVTDESQKYCCVVHVKAEGVIVPKTSCVQFIVVDPPLITDSPSNLTFNVSDSITLTCNASGRPEPDITWTKLTEPSQVLSDSNILQLNITGKETQGEYSCRANNSFGSPSVRRFYITVQYKPTISFPPRSQNITEGQSLTLHCNATGNPKPDIIWKNPQSDVVGHDNIFTLNATTKDDAGKYTCIAANVVGRDEATASIDIYYPPSVLHPPSEKTLKINESNSLQLFCNASGNPVPTVTLHRSGGILKTSKGSLAYTIKANRSEAGTYECMARNAYGNDSWNILFIVQYAPSIDPSTGGIVQAVEGSTLEVICNASGLPKPFVRWKRNGEYVSNSLVLTMRNVSRSEAGRYHCEAENILGLDTWNIELGIYYPPSILNPPAEKTLKINESNSLQLFCNASGNPVPTVTLHRSGRILKTSKGSLAYTINKANRSDAGTYECMARNAYGNDSRNTLFIIQYAPAIVPSTGGIVQAVEGSTLEVICNASGLPRPFVQWKRNGVYISNSSVLTMRNVSRSEAGSYYCEAENIFGLDTWDIAVEIHYPPEIIWMARETKLNETQQERLFCNATGNPQPNVTWIGPTNQRKWNVKQASLWVGKNNRSDAGFYTCMARNYLANVTRRTKVIVQYKPYNTSLSVRTPGGIAVLNDSLLLICQADSVPSPDRYNFFLNGKTIVETKNNTRTIHRVTAKDQGTYACVPFNILGQGQRSEVNVTVYERATITEGPDDVTANETSTVTLHCRARGNPVPNITWSKGMAPVGHGGNLTLVNVTREQAGRYQCTASNGIRPPATASAVLTVNFAPEISLAKKQVETSMNKAVNLSCDVIGVPLSLVTWSRNGTIRSIVLSPSRKRSLLEVTPMKPGDFGEYACSASNIAGRQNKSITLVRVERPGVPTNLSVIPGQNSIEITWEPPLTDGGLDIQGYKVEVPTKEGAQEPRTCDDVVNRPDVTSCRVSRLESGMLYIVRVFARNRLGFGEAAVMEVETVEKEEVSPTGSESKSSDLTMEVYIGIGIGAGVILVILITLAYWGMRKKSNEASISTLELKGQKVLNLYDNPSQNANTMNAEEKKEVETAYGVHSV